MWVLVIAVVSGNGLDVHPRDGAWVVTPTKQECMARGMHVIADTNIKMIQKFGPEGEGYMKPFCLKIPSYLEGAWR